MKKKIVLFDGICNLCNASVQFIIEHDKKNAFQFSSLQSDFGQEILSKNHLNTTDFDSVLLVDNNQIFDRSDAALRIAKELDFPIRLLSVFLIIPKPIRDSFYSIIAKNRYKWFGKKESCWIPTAELKSKFID